MYMYWLCIKSKYIFKTKPRLRTNEVVTSATRRVDPNVCDCYKSGSSLLQHLHTLRPFHHESHDINTVLPPSPIIAGKPWHPSSHISRQQVQHQPTSKSSPPTARTSPSASQKDVYDHSYSPTTSTASTS